MALCQWVYTVYTACRCVCVSVQIAGFAHALGERCLSPRLCLMSCVHTCVCLCVCPSVPLPVWAAVFALHDWTLRSVCLCECVGEIERGRDACTSCFRLTAYRQSGHASAISGKKGRSRAITTLPSFITGDGNQNSPLPTHALTLRWGGGGGGGDGRDTDWTERVVSIHRRAKEMKKV